MVELPFLSFLVHLLLFYGIISLQNGKSWLLIHDFLFVRVPISIYKLATTKRDLWLCSSNRIDNNFKIFKIDPFETTAFDSSEIFNRCGALIFVIDAQADYEEALKRMIPAITRAYTINKNIKFEVAISIAYLNSNPHLSLFFSFRFLCIRLMV